MKHIAILGAGISGLSLGWFLKQKYGSSLKLSIIEQQSRPGGWIKTDEQEGFLFEQGPRGFVPSGNGEVTLKLIEELGISSELIRASPEAKKRYLYLDHHLQAVSPKLLLAKGRWKNLLREYWMPPLSPPEEEVQAFFIKRFGRSFAEEIVFPCLQGIFGSQGKNLCLRSALPRLYSIERAQGSLLKAFLKKKRKKTDPALFSFKSGLETLPKQLAEKLQRDLNLSTSVKKIVNASTLETSSGLLHVDHIICTLPSFTLEQLLPEAFLTLHANPFHTLTVLHLGFQEAAFPLHGFGYLSALKEEKGFLGMTWDSLVFPQQGPCGQVRLTLLFRGAFAQDTLSPLGKEILEKHLNFHAQPDFIKSRVLTHAIPHYLPGHIDRVRSLDALKITFAGNSYSGIGMNDCIAEAHSLANKLLFL